MNEEKFTGKADIYDKFRPSYPAELIDWLYEKTGAKTVADIGAGTGIFTKCLSAKPWKITAVEPNADMMGILKQNMGQSSALEEIINASAEDTGIPANSIDLVTAAQAFHWFDKGKFKAECERILTPNGHLAIVWNNHLQNDFMNERDEIFDECCGMSNSMAWEVTDSDSFLRNEYFSETEYFRLEHTVNMNEERFVWYCLSHSYAPKEEDDEHLFGYFVCEIRSLFWKYQKNDIVELPLETACYLGNFN